MGRRIAKLCTSADSGLTILKATVLAAISTRRQTYTQVNPDLERHPKYSECAACLEYARIAATRLRLSSHRLRVETGRWARIPRDARVCSCGTGSVQDEQHVLLHCELSKDLRQSFPQANTATNIANLFRVKDTRQLVDFCYAILDRFG